VNKKFVTDVYEEIMDFIVKDLNNSTNNEINYFMKCFNGENNTNEEEFKAIIRIW
jgi:hypothetical protein